MVSPKILILNQRQPAVQLAKPLYYVKPRRFTLNQCNRKLSTTGVACPGLIRCTVWNTCIQQNVRQVSVLNETESVRNWLRSKYFSCRKNN